MSASQLVDLTIHHLYLVLLPVREWLFTLCCNGDRAHHILNVVSNCLIFRWPATKCMNVWWQHSERLQVGVTLAEEAICQPGPAHPEPVHLDHRTNSRLTIRSRTPFARHSGRSVKRAARTGSLHDWYFSAVYVPCCLNLTQNYHTLCRLIVITSSS